MKKHTLNNTIVLLFTLLFVFSEVNSQCLSINSIPYVENFETLTDAAPTPWANNWTTSGFNWTPETSNTQSNNTGPNMDHTTMVADSGIYMFTEVSGTTLGDSAMLNSPCISLAGASNPELKFWYHKYGDVGEMGDLFIDVYSNTTNTWTRGIDQILGVTHTGYANVDPWTERIIDLSAFTEDTIYIRFRTYRVDTKPQGDMAIDDITIAEKPTNASYYCSKVDVIPYMEDFDTISDGASSPWVNGWETTSGFEWKPETSFTPSWSSTGPFQDHTTGNGTYMYTEASSQSTGDSAMLTGTCISLTGVSNPELKFWYHKYGSLMGDLFVDVYSYGTNSWTRNIDEILGETHTGNATVDPWTERAVSLKDFAGDTIYLRFRGTRGGSSGDMAIDDISIEETFPIVANFSMSNSNPQFQETVSFTDLSTNTPTSWYWDFGDTSTSTLQNPTHAYSSSGLKTVTLIASNATHADTTSQTLTVQVQPTLTFNPGSFNVNLSCGDSTSQNLTIYNIGANPLNITGGTIGAGGMSDSSTIAYNSAAATTTHHFNLINSGIDTLFLWVNANGDYDQGLSQNEIISNVLVDGNSLGTAAGQSLTVGNWDSTLFYITGSSLTNILIDDQLTVEVVSGSGVNIGVGGLDQHHVRIFTKTETWVSGTIPNTSIPSGDSTIVNVDFNGFGLYQGMYTTTIEVESNDPNSPLIIPVTLNISGTAEIALSDSCVDFGGVIINETSIDTIEIINIGCDTIKLSSIISSNTSCIVNSISGDTLLPGQSSFVIIELTPTSLGAISGELNIFSNLPDTSICFTGLGSNFVSDFVFSDQDSCSALVSFTDISRDAPTSWSWDFGDGSAINTAQNPTHYFDSVGTYTVSLIACNALWCDTTTQTITINFILDYDIEITGLQEINEVLNYAVLGAGIVSVNWDFGDNSIPDLNLTPTHSYIDTGCYTVIANVFNIEGCIFDITKEVCITDPLLGIPDLSTYDISVYPNPAKDRLVIGTGEKVGKLSVDIINLLGTHVYREDITLDRNSEVIAVDELERGTYFVKLTTSNGSFITKKIVLE